jgi:hypothetical protein
VGSGCSSNVAEWNQQEASMVLLHPHKMVHLMQPCTHLTGVWKLLCQLLALVVIAWVLQAYRQLGNAAP